MNHIKQLFIAICFLGILIYGCKEEENTPTNPTDQEVEYKFSFSMDENFSFHEQEKKINEIALLLYDDKEQFICSAYSTSSEIVLRISGEQRAAKALALANFSEKGDWGILILKDGKLEQVDLKANIQAHIKSPATWEECKKLGFGTKKEDKTDAAPISLPIPMSGMAEISSEKLYHIRLAPLVCKVTLKNTSTEYPNIKEVTFSNVAAFSPFITPKEEPTTAFTCTIKDTQPKIDGKEDSNAPEEISYYLPWGTGNRLSATLKNASDEERETLPYPIHTVAGKEPVVIEISEKQFTVELKYNGVVLGNELEVPVKASSGTLEMKTSTGKSEEDGRLSLRAANNGHAWARINHSWSLIDPDEIYHERTESLLEFEENPGPAREMIAEFYSRKSGLVYHRMIFKQPAASDYLTFSSSSLRVDRYGNVYDEPYSLTVQSNNVWEIRCADSWVKTDYIPNNRSQTVGVTVEENKTGQARSTSLEFLVDGKVAKTFPISQSIEENNTFTLKYELNLIMTTTNNKFKDLNPYNQDIYYANNVEIYNPGTSTYGDETIKMVSNDTYGFVTDAPDSFNKMEVKNIRSRLLVYPNYRGVESSQANNNGITISNKRYSLAFFRQIRYTLLIPAGVKRNQKVIYDIEINNITGNATHDTPRITSRIVDQ